MSQENVLNYQ